MTEIAGCTITDSSFDYCWLAASSLQFSRLRNVTFVNCTFHKTDIEDENAIEFPFKTTTLPDHAVIAIEKSANIRRSFTIP